MKKIKNIFKFKGKHNGKTRDDLNREYREHAVELGHLEYQISVMKKDRDYRLSEMNKIGLAAARILPKEEKEAVPPQQGDNNEPA